MGIKKIKVGIIGSGYMAEEYIKVLKKNNSINVIGVVSKSLDNAKKFAKKNKINFFSSIDDMYKKTKPDGFIVAVSELALKKVLLKVFKYKSTNLVEKPIGINYEESKYITNIAKKSKSRNFVAFNRRHYENINFLKKELVKDKTKRIVLIEDQEYQNYNDIFPRKVIKNWMYANSIHLIDLFFVLCRGEILSIKNKINLKYKKYSFILSEIKFKSGDIGIYKCLWNTPGPWSVSVNTEKKYYLLKPIEKLLIQEKKNKRPQEIKFINENYKPGLTNQIKMFIKSIQKNKNYLPTFEDSLLSMKLVQRIYEKK